MTGRDIKHEKDDLLEQVRSLTPGYEALSLLKTIREHYDWAIDGYRNSLKILKQTMYADNSHFLLELIQNADDAQFPDGGPAELRFTIYDGQIELFYNEKGFSLDDIIAITDTGSSTKINRKNTAHSFIGEKGIGFKSVFSLASEVEIESYPWHFILRDEQERFIIPEPVRDETAVERNGTTLRIRFKKQKDLAHVANVIKGYVDANGIESFLFLQRLSKFTVVDLRDNQEDVIGIEIEPFDRSSDFAKIHFIDTDTYYEYCLYHEDIEFPAHLVRERWEKLDHGDEPLKRRISVAALVDNPEDFTPAGRLFCYLPTEVALPVPLYLQVDGKTTSSREKLFDPDLDPWNNHLIKQLPGFLCRAILKWREHPVVSTRLPDYIPDDVGEGQLAEVFQKFIEILDDQPWIKTFEGTDPQWISPVDAWVAPEILVELLEKYPNFRQAAEEAGEVTFMSPGWAQTKKWAYLWEQERYNIPRIYPHIFADILTNVALPDELSTDEEIIKLYYYIMKWNEKDKWSDADLEKLTYAPIFPMSEAEVGGWGPLRTNETDTIFWLRSDSRRREAGLKGIAEYRLVNPSYTHEVKVQTGGNRDQQLKSEEKKRNKIVRDFLELLNITELNEQGLLKEIQVPYLLDNRRIDDDKDAANRLKVLKAIFDTYRARSSLREDNNYMADLSSLVDAYFFGKDGEQYPLKQLILPKRLQTSKDKLYADSKLAELSLPELFFKDERGETFKQEQDLKNCEILRQFLVDCGIRIKPIFEFSKETFDSAYLFKQLDEERFEQWDRYVHGDFTISNEVYIEEVLLDDATMDIIKRGIRQDLAASAIYNAWQQLFAQERPGYSDNYRGKVIPGYFKAVYTRFSQRRVLVREDWWAGVEPKIVPLTTVSGELTTVSAALRTTVAQLKCFKAAVKLLPFIVEANQGTIGCYQSLYLDTLKVKRPAVQDLNMLWAELESNRYSEIINVASEYADAGISLEGLKVFDTVNNCLRPAAEFCIGSGTLVEPPNLETQYGAQGRILGEKLGLRVEGGAEHLISVLDQIISGDEIDEKHYDQLINLLCHFRSMNTMEKSQLVGRLTKLWEKKGLKNPPILLVNSKAMAGKLTNAGFTIIALEAQAQMKKALEKTAKALGFFDLADIGYIKANGETSLDDNDKAALIKIYDGYVDYLRKEDAEEDSNQVARLEELLADLLPGEVLAESIHKADEVIRQIENRDNKVEQNLRLPYLDAKHKRFYVEKFLSSEEIFAQILNYCKFERTYHRALSDVRRIAARQTRNDRPDASSSHYYQTSMGEFAATADDVVSKVQSRLTDERPANNSNDEYISWRVGIDHEAEQEMFSSIKNHFAKTLAAGPEIYEKRRRAAVKRHSKTSTNDTKIIDPWAQKPKEFFKAEYGGKCQICGTELNLSTGDKWIETYRIYEPQGKDWWGDRLFNILGLCPNCHALARHGGGRDLSRIFSTAEDVLNQNVLLEQVPEFNGDYYVIPIKINGHDRSLVISQHHMSYFIALVNSEAETG